MDIKLLQLVAVGLIAFSTSVEGREETREGCINTRSGRPDGNEGSGVVYNDQPQHGWVYTRWGRPDCNVGSDLVYSGIAAGSRHHERHQSGGGANILCVPNDPEFVNPVAGEGSERAFLYSVKHQISDFPRLAPYDSFDVSCAVCKANRRHSHVMIPGKNTCPSNYWNREYQGYLMAERSNEAHHKSMFFCVDRDPSPIPGSNGSFNGSAILDLVEPKCSTTGGGLPCDKFITGYEFPCAVCTL